VTLQHEDQSGHALLAGPDAQALPGGLVPALTSAASGAGQQPRKACCSGHLSPAQAPASRGLPGHDLLIEPLRDPVSLIKNLGCQAPSISSLKGSP
jgi:hypothetical protein